MRNSIEYLLNSLARFIEKEQPDEGHKHRFLKKLKGRKETGNFFAFKPHYWTAAALLVLMSFVAGLQFFVPSTSPSNDFDKATLYYTHYINKQLEQIDQEDNTEYQKLIVDSKKQLVRLETAYHRLMDEFKNNAVHPILIQAMIENLQHRSDVLHELEEKINTLKNESYEKEVL